MGDYVLEGLLPGGSSSVSLFSSPEYDEIWARAESKTAELLQRIQPSRSSEERRMAVIDYVERLIERNFNCKVFAFGSVPLKTYLPNGDIDLTAISELPFDDTWADDLCHILEDEERSHIAKFQVKEVKCIRAEVPVVKCLVENIIVDITFNQIGGLSTLCFLEEVDRLIGQNHLFKRSLILVKAWCFYESRILGAYHGLLSTYALETLVLYVFHVFHWSLRGPLEVLFRFLQFFSNFDWNKYCLTLWGPIPLVSLHNMAVESHRKHKSQSLVSEAFLNACREAYTVYPGSQGSQGKPFSQKFMNVLDPLRSDNNLGRSVNKGNFVRIHSAFSYGAGQLEKLFKSPRKCLDENMVAFFRNTESHCRGHRPDAPDLYFKQSQAHMDFFSCGDKVRSRIAVSKGGIDPKVALEVQQPQQENSGSLMQNRSYKQTLLGNAFGEVHLQAESETKSSVTRTSVSDAYIVDITTAHRVQDSGQTTGRRRKTGKVSSILAKERVHNLDVGTGLSKNNSISNSRNCRVHVEGFANCQNISCNCDSCNNLRNSTPVRDQRSSSTNSRTISMLGPLVSVENKGHISEEGVLQKLHDGAELIEGAIRLNMDNTCGVIERENFGKPQRNLVSIKASVFRQQKPIDGDTKPYNTQSKSQIPHASLQDSFIVNQSTRDPTTLLVTSGVTTTSNRAAPSHPGLRKKIAFIRTASDSLRSGESQQGLSNHQCGSKNLFQSNSDSNIAKGTDIDLECVETLKSPHGFLDFSESTGNELVWFTCKDGTFGRSESSLKALEQEVRSCGVAKETKSQTVQNGIREWQQGIPSNSRFFEHEKNWCENDFLNCNTVRTLPKMLDLDEGPASEAVETGSQGQQPGVRKHKSEFVTKEVKHKYSASDFNSRSFDSDEERKMDLNCSMNGIKNDKEMTSSLDSLIEERDQIEASFMQLNPSHQPLSLPQTKENMYHDSDSLRNHCQRMNTALDEKGILELGDTDTLILGPDSDNCLSKDIFSFSETMMGSDITISRGINSMSQEDTEMEEREATFLGGDFANRLQISGGKDEFFEIRDAEADILKGDFAANLKNLEAGRCFQSARLYESIPSPSTTMFHRRYIKGGFAWEGAGRNATVKADILAQFSSSRNGALPVLALNGATVRTRGAMPGSFLAEGFPKVQKGTGTFFPTVRHGFDRERRLPSGVKGQRAVTSIDFCDPVNQNGTSACRSRNQGQKKRDVQNKPKSRLDRKSIEIKVKERDSDISWEDSVHTNTLWSPSTPVGNFVCPFNRDGDPGFFSDTIVNGTDYLSKSPALMVLPSGSSKDLPIEKLEFGSFGPGGLEGSLLGSLQQVSLVQEDDESVQNQQNSQHREPSKSFESHAKSGHCVELHPSLPQGSYQLTDEDFPPLTFRSQRERSTGFVVQKS